MDVGAGAVITEVRFECESRHELVAVGGVRTHHGQLVQYVPDQGAGATHVHVTQQRLTVGRTRLLHPHVRAETELTEGVGARRVDRVNEGLPTHMAEKVLVYVIRVVVEMVLARLVALTAHLAHHNVAHSSDLEAARLSEAGFSASPQTPLPLYARCHDVSRTVAN